MENHRAANPWGRQNTLIAKLLPVIPAVAVASVMLSSLLAGMPNTVAARIYGGPPGHDGTIAWRVVASWRDRGSYVPLAQQQLSIQSHDALLAVGTTDNEGAWEARIPLHSLPSATDPLDITVRCHNGKNSGDVLLQAPIALYPPAWSTSIRRLSHRIEGRRTGPLQVDVSLMRGTIAATFPERAVVRVTSNSTPIPGARVVLTGDGVSFQPSHTLSTNAQGRAEVTLVAPLPSSTIEVQATDASGQSGTFEGVLPVRAGAFWIDPDRLVQNTIAVTSPVGHPYAYVTVFDEHARLFGARLSLTRDAFGGATATMPLPSRAHSWILAIPDPPGAEIERQSLAWPVITSPDEPAEATHVSTPMLADGMPAAIAASKERRHAHRLRALLILTAAAMIETGLIGLRSRNARQQIKQLLASDVEIEISVSRTVVGGFRFWLMMLIATSLIAVAFGILAFVTWWGM